jgi:hypothetical protein
MCAEIQQNYDVHLVGAGCVVCAQVRMGLDSGSKVWNPGTWIRCVHSSRNRNWFLIWIAGSGISE